MRALFCWSLTISICAWSAFGTTSGQQQASLSSPPPIDHHAHLGSARATKGLAVMREYFGEPGPPGDTIPQTVEGFISRMDSSGVKLSVLLSVAYWFGSVPLQGPDEQVNVR